MQKPSCLTSNEKRVYSKKVKSWNYKIDRHTEQEKRVKLQTLKHLQVVVSVVNSALMKKVSHYINVTSAQIRHRKEETVNTQRTKKATKTNVKTQTKISTNEHTKKNGGKGRPKTGQRKQLFHIKLKEKTRNS